MKEKYDTLIIGAGPAGLSAAIYLGRFNRTVLVVDKGEGRSTYPQVNENYLGFPEGIHATDLRKKGRAQAERFGVDFVEDEIVEIKGKSGNFTCEGEQNKYSSRTIILATGVIDIFPIFEDYEEYVGKSMYWCITCDGYKTIDKNIVIVGNTDDAAITAMQFLNYTKKITMITNTEPGGTNISSTVLLNLKKHSIPLKEARIVNAEGKEGQMDILNLNDGSSLKLDLLFSQQGSNPNCSLASKLNLKMTNEGCINTDKDQRTSMEGIYAAGDVTRHHSHQIVAAAHEGSIAAEAANYDMYEPYQKHES